MYKKNMKNEKNINLMDNQEISGIEVEGQVAQNIVELLNSRAQNLSESEAQRLSAARSQAVNHLANRQLKLAADGSTSRNGNALRWFGHHVGHYFEQHRLMSAGLVVLTMLLTFVAVQQLGGSSNLENSDAFLLASDLPPEAYADKGFDTWLDTN